MQVCNIPSTNAEYQCRTTATFVILIHKWRMDGVQVVGSTSRGEAFALKIIDANKPALFAASVEVMEQLGWLDDTQRAALQPWRAQAIVNARGLQVGERRPVFRLLLN